MLAEKEAGTLQRPWSNGAGALYPARYEGISPEEDGQWSEGRDIWLREMAGFRNGKGREVGTPDGRGRKKVWMKEAS